MNNDFLVSPQETTGATCPKCNLPYEQPPAYPTPCGNCGLKFGVFLFDPPEKPLDHPEIAMPDDVTCLFHPGKKAVQVCDGTGSYICALCVIPVGEKTYSADFINNGGLKNINGVEVFDRSLPRPDTAASVCAVLALLSSCTIFMAPIFMVVSMVYYFKHLKTKRENKLYKRVTSQLTTAVLPVLYVLATLVVAGIILSIILDF